jgi:hypothetical protein
MHIIPFVCLFQAIHRQCADILGMLSGTLIHKFKPFQINYSLQVVFTFNFPTCVFKIILYSHFTWVKYIQKLQNN